MTTAINIQRAISTNSLSLRDKILIVLPKVALLPLLMALTFSNINAEESSEKLLTHAFSNTIRDQPPILIPPCRSPRETMRSFYSITKLIKDVFQRSSKTGDIDWNQERKLITYYSKLRSLIDYSKLPQKEVFAVADVIISQLSEILDRIPVPSLSTIPDRGNVEKNKLEYWRVPDTEIALIRIKTGPRKNDWIFSSETIIKTATLYETSKSMPYLPDANIGIIQNRSGLLEHYLSYTGALIPMNFTEHLPLWSLVKFFNVPIWKFIMTFILLLSIFIISVIIFKLTRYPSDRKKDSNSITLNLRRFVLPLFLISTLPVLIYFVTIDLRIRLISLEVIDDTLWGIFFIVAFWLCLSAGNLIASLIIHLPSFPHASFDINLVKILARLFSATVGIFIVFQGLQQLGVSMIPLVAGASIGGFAFALAVKPTLSNVISGILIYSDKPFRIGERIAIKNHEGFVESIGLRSTRIRTLDGHLLSIPNDDVCNSELENISKRPYIKRKMNITVTYDTSPEKIVLAMKIIEQILSLDEDKDMTAEELGRPPNRCIHHNPDFQPKISFNELNADSLNILVMYWFEPPDISLYLQHCTWINSELIRRFKNAEIDFAFPTQTIEYKPAGMTIPTIEAK